MSVVVDPITNRCVERGRQICETTCFELSGESIKCLSYDDGSSRYTTDSELLITQLSSSPIFQPGMIHVIDRVPADCRYNSIPTCCGSISTSAEPTTPPPLSNWVLGETIILTELPEGAVEVACSEAISLSGANFEIDTDALCQCIGSLSGAGIAVAGGTSNGTVSASNTATVYIPLSDRARAITIVLEENTMFSVDVTMSDTTVNSSASFGGGISLEYQKTEPTVSAVEITELDGNQSRYIVNWQSLNF